MVRDSFVCFAVVAVCLSLPVQVFSQCPNPTVDLSLKPPTLNLVSVGDQLIRGTVPNGTTGTIQVCLNGTALGAPVPIDESNSFVASVGVGKAVKTLEKVSVQLISAGKYGVPTEAIADSCAADASAAVGAPAQPTLTRLSANRYSGKVVGANAGSVRICVNDRPVMGIHGTASIQSDGSFTGTSIDAGVGDKVEAQAFISAGGATVYGKPSAPKTVNLKDNGTTAVIAIAGVEQSGYSSLGQQTTPFVEFSLLGPLAKRWGGWGRVRLLGAPQPSTQGIVSTFTDPTGQLTTQDYSKVGESLDFVFGSAWKITELASAGKGWSVITGVGSTTPLSSQAVALTYKAPGPGTIECTTLTSRFTVQNGYAPGLTQAPSGSATCLAGGYTDVAFSNQDRSSFIRKWEVGLRTSAPSTCSSESSCPTAYGVLDLTVGQDEAITRGLLRHFVVKLDGVYPISISGNQTFLYIYGSVYLRTSRNQDLSPLILQTETASVSVPSATVIVLPLQQPDRDFYRLGVGLDLHQVFCKMFTCPSS